MGLDSPDLSSCHHPIQHHRSSSPSLSVQFHLVISVTVLSSDSPLLHARSISLLCVARFFLLQSSTATFHLLLCVCSIQLTFSILLDVNERVNKSTMR